MPVAVEAREVEKWFGQNRVLRKVSLTVSQHEVICIIGPSGCGKSTLLRCIDRLEEVQGGYIRVGDVVVSHPASDEAALRRKVAMVFQSYNLFPHMTVLQNITLAPRKVLRMSASAAREQALELLNRIGLADKAYSYPESLSGGQQQRVAIVRALAMQPEVLLLDEITSSLDPELVAEVLDLLKQLAAERVTMMIVTHEMAFARDVADRVLFMDEGQIHEEGPAKDVLTRPQKDRTQQFLKRIMQAGRL